MPGPIARVRCAQSRARTTPFLLKCPRLLKWRAVYPNIVYKKMTAQDLQAVHDIEVRCYPNPWSTSVMADCIRSHYECIKATVDGEIIAYAFLMIGHEEAHLLNIAVDPSWQRQGVAFRFLNHLVLVSRYWHARSLLLEARESNEPAIQLYRKFGFYPIGVRKNYYRHSGIKENALVMKYRIAAS